MGPKARAKAPIDRKMPRSAPFWLTEPYEENSVERVGITIAEE